MVHTQYQHKTLIQCEDRIFDTMWWSYFWYNVMVVSLIICDGCIFDSNTGFLYTLTPHWNCCCQRWWSPLIWVRSQDKSQTSSNWCSKTTFSRSLLFSAQLVSRSTWSLNQGTSSTVTTSAFLPLIFCYSFADLLLFFRWSFAILFFHCSILSLIFRDSFNLRRWYVHQCDFTDYVQTIWTFWIQTFPKILGDFTSPLS